MSTKLKNNIGETVILVYNTAISNHVLRIAEDHKKHDEQRLAQHMTNNERNDEKKLY